MQAAIITAPKECRLAEVPLPDPAEGEVRVKLEGCGICGSNLAPWEGRPWFRYPMAPGELGHEGWGRVEAKGRGVRTVSEGDRVALLSYRAYAECDLAREECVVKLPKALEQQPFPGEALGCAVNVFRRSEIHSGDNVAIIGIGFLGAVLAGLSASAGARVTAISRRPFALEIAKKMGSSSTLCWGDDNNHEIVERVQSETGSKGCDRVIEATGLQSALDLAGELTRERGRLLIAGYHQDGMRVVNMQLWNWRGLDVINAHERDPKVYRDGMEQAIQAIADGRLQTSPLYTHSFKLEQLSDGFNAMKRREDGFLKGLAINC